LNEKCILQYYEIIHKNVAVGITLVMGKFTLPARMKLSLDDDEV